MGNCPPDEVTPGSAGRMAARRSRGISPEQAPRGRHADESRRRQRAAQAQGDRDRRDHGRASSGADAAVLTEYRGLTVSQIANLRAALRPAATDYKIFKNTLARRAASDAGLAELVDAARGAGCDRVRPPGGRRRGHRGQGAARLRPDQPEPRREGRHPRRPRCSRPQDVEALADVPPRDELLARLAGGFQAPLTKAAGLFQAFTRNFAYGLKALRRPTRRRRRSAAADGPDAAGSREPTTAAPAAAPAGESDHEQAAEADGTAPKPRPSPRRTPRRRAKPNNRSKHHGNT